MKIGVLSDTHGHLDRRIFRIFEGVGHILHGGDIGYPSLVMELESLAPVTAVLGNTDDARFDFRELEVISLGGRKFLLHHIVDPWAPGDRLTRALQQHAPDVVVFGHTHKPFHEILDGRLYFNPGYAGKPRFGMERTVAVLELFKDEIGVAFHSLDGDPRE